MSNGDAQDLENREHTMQKLTLMVCPHDTAKGPERWYRLAQYLSQKLDAEATFQLALDFQDFHNHMESADIIYANPMDTFKLLNEAGFMPLVKPTELYDELVFIANNDIPNPTLEALQGTHIATVTRMLPSNIARYMLKKRSIEPAEFRNRDSWLAVIRTVWQRELDYGIVYKDTFDDLSDQGKEMTNAFAASDERVAFHSVSINPSCSDKKAALENIFLTMDADADGQAVLSDLHRIQKWEPITQEELGMIQYLIESYA